MPGNLGGSIRTPGFEIVHDLSQRFDVAPELCDLTVIEERHACQHVLDVEILDELAQPSTPLRDLDVGSPFVVWITLAHDEPRAFETGKRTGSNHVSLDIMELGESGRG